MFSSCLLDDGRHGWRWSHGWRRCHHRGCSHHRWRGCCHGHHRRNWRRHGRRCHWGLLSGVHPRLRKNTSPKSRKNSRSQSSLILKFRRVTIRGAQPSARRSEEICLSEGSAGSLRGLCGGLSEGSAGLCGVLRGSARFPEGFRE